VATRLVAPEATNQAVRAVMRANRSTDTTPELAVRRTAFALGYRYRVHSRHLPGSPDLVFPGRCKVIFVHGCFWHQHASGKCPLRSHPRTNLQYWRPKLSRNVARDSKHVSALRWQGWSVKVIWECETKNEWSLAKALRKFLGPSGQ
jgi:DNA mismatch endonuclease (patch repair protein)